MPKRGETLPVILSPEEVVRFLDGVARLKHRMILTTCYAAGLRLSEALRLQVTDVDSDRMVLHVAQGKGARDRYVMLSPTLLQQLRAWWRIERPAQWLFPGRQPGQPMQKGTVQWACRLARYRSRLGKPVTPHSLYGKMRGSLRYTPGLFGTVLIGQSLNRYRCARSNAIRQSLISNGLSLRRCGR